MVTTINPSDWEKSYDGTLSAAASPVVINVHSDIGSTANGGSILFKDANAELEVMDNKGNWGEKVTIYKGESMDLRQFPAFMQLRLTRDSADTAYRVFVTNYPRHEK